MLQIPINQASGTITCLWSN